MTGLTSVTVRFASSVTMECMIDVKRRNSTILFDNDGRHCRLSSSPHRIITSIPLHRRSSTPSSCHTRSIPIR
jgi:hypothetical protein